MIPMADRSTVGMADRKFAAFARHDRSFALVRRPRAQYKTSRGAHDDKRASLDNTQ